MQTTEIAIYGGGGFARELAWLVESCNVAREVYRVVCFVDDNEANQGKALNNIPVMDLHTARETFPLSRLVVGVGTPLTRQRLTEKATAAGFEFEAIIHRGVERSKWIEIGAGSVICAGSILTVNIVLGQHVHLNLDCTIGHDSIVGDYTTLAPGVHVSGWVHFGKRVYVGTGAVLINGIPGTPLTIGDDAIIGAGACVTESVPASVTVVGVPAKPIRRG